MPSTKSRTNPGKRITHQNTTDTISQTTLFNMVTKKQQKAATAKQTHPGQPKA
jgi:hypothetical protein